MSTGLSWWPRTEMTCSMSQPGVIRMIDSDTAITGETRWWR